MAEERRKNREKDVGERMKENGESVYPTPSGEAHTANEIKTMNNNVLKQKMLRTKETVSSP